MTLILMVFDDSHLLSDLICLYCAKILFLLDPESISSCANREISQMLIDGHDGQSFSWTSMSIEPWLSTSNCCQISCHLKLRR